MLDLISLAVVLGFVGLTALLIDLCARV